MSHDNTKNNDNKTSAIASDLLLALAKQMEGSIKAPKSAPSSDELCGQLLEQNRRPNAFQKRLVAWRRAMGTDDGTVTRGTASGASTSPPRPRQTKKKGK